MSVIDTPAIDKILAGGSAIRNRPQAKAELASLRQQNEQLEEALRLARSISERMRDAFVNGNEVRFTIEANELSLHLAESAALLHPTDDKIEPSPEDLLRREQEGGADA